MLLENDMKLHDLRTMAIAAALTCAASVAGCGTGSVESAQTAERARDAQAAAHRDAEVYLASNEYNLVPKTDGGGGICSVGGEVSVDCQGSFSNCRVAGSVSVRCTP
jgi:hypothetical protein